MRLRSRNRRAFKAFSHSVVCRIAARRSGIRSCPRSLGSRLIRRQMSASSSTAAMLPFLTRPAPRARLVDFYRKVRPYGAWKPVAARAGVQPAAGLAGMLGQWIAGSVMVIAATLSIGAFLLGDTRAGVIYLVVAVCGTVGIWGALRSRPLAGREAGEPLR